MLSARLISDSELVLTEAASAKSSREEQRNFSLFFFTQFLTNEKVTHDRIWNKSFISRREHRDTAKQTWLRISVSWRILEETKAIISVDPDDRGEQGSCNGDFTRYDKYVSGSSCGTYRSKLKLIKDDLAGITCFRDYLFQLRREERHSYAEIY